MNREPTWQRLLKQREYRALLITTRARLVASAFGVVAAALTTSPGTERLLTVGLFAVYVATTTWLLVQLREVQRIRTVGLAGATLDSALLVGFPLIWHAVLTSSDRPMVHLLGHQLTTLTWIIITINCVALRPQYPAIVTAVGTTVHLCLAYLAVTDPRLAHYPGGLDKILSASGRGEGDLLLAAILVALGGGGLSLLTRSVRKLVAEVIEGEVRQYELREAQVQLLMETRISTLAQLVAGVLHEINTPLGVMSSAADTANRSLGKLRERTRSAEDRTAERAFEALEGSIKLTRDAGQRLSEVVRAIKGFSHLDRGDRQSLDMSQLTRDVVALQRPTVGDGVRWNLDLTDGALTQGDGGRLSQAISTLVNNAAEAVADNGTVSVSTMLDGDQVVVRVADDGKGMAAEQLEGLFEVELGAAERVKARFGLPTCRSVVHTHGGEIHVESEPGRGTSFTITLPREPSDGKTQAPRGGSPTSTSPQGE